MEKAGAYEDETRPRLECGGAGECAGPKMGTSVLFSLSCRKVLEVLVIQDITSSRQFRRDLSNMNHQVSVESTADYCLSPEEAYKMRIK